MTARLPELQWTREMAVRFWDYESNFPERYFTYQHGAEVVTQEELGGAEMHTAVSGLGEYLAEDDRHALGMARDVISRLASRARPGIHVGAPGWIAGQARNDRPTS